MSSPTDFERAYERIISTMAEKYDLTDVERMLIEEAVIEGYYAGAEAATLKAQRVVTQTLIDEGSDAN